MGGQEWDFRGEESRRISPGMRSASCEPAGSREPGVHCLLVRRAALLGIAAAAAALVAACGDNDEPDKTAACRLGARSSASTIQDRKIIGVAAPYAADARRSPRATTSSRPRSRARRAAAWQIVAARAAADPARRAGARAAASAASRRSRRGTRGTRATTSSASSRSSTATSAPTGRRARAPIAAGPRPRVERDRARRDPEWPEQRYLDYLAAIDTARRSSRASAAPRASATARARSATCSRATRGCTLPPRPGARSVRAGPRARGPARRRDRARRRSTACEWRVLGPFQAGAGAGHGDHRAATAMPTSTCAAAPRPTAEDFDCRSRGGDSDETCTVDGGGPVYVAVFGAQASARRCRRSSTSPTTSRDPTCLDGEMPRDAVLVKADWRRQLPGELLPMLRHDAARGWRRGSTATRRGTADGAAESAARGHLHRHARERRAVPAARAPHHDEGARSLDLDHAVVVGAARHRLRRRPPGRRRGAARPVDATTRCASRRSYVERDPDPRGGFGGTLGDALAAVHGGAGAPTWCSNPYLELGPGNAATNCIGCHQHGGTRADARGDPRRRSRTTARRACATTSSPTTCGRSRAATARTSRRIVQAEVDYWDANDP